jgi:hypothetical protein
LLVRTCVERLLEVAHGFSAAGETEDALHLQDWSRRSTRVGKQESSDDIHSEVLVPSYRCPDT